MSRRRLSFTERRRRQLALKVNTLERFETKTSVGDLSSPMGVAYRALISAGLYQAAFGARLRDPADQPATARGATAQRAPRPLAGPALAKVKPAAPGGGGGGRSGLELVSSRPMPVASRGDWLTFAGPAARLVALPGFTPIPAAAQPATQGGGGPAYGGTVGSTSGRGAITPLRIASPPAPDPMSAGAPAATSASSILAGVGTLAMADPSGGGPGLGGMTAFGGGGGGGEGDPSGGFEALDSGLFDVPGIDNTVALGQFDNFVLYTLDYNDGNVIFPGFAQLAALGASVDLRAQARDDILDTYTFSWNTAGLSNANTISASGHRLTFKWNTNAPMPQTDSVTLTATQVGTGLTEQQTYSFRVPSGSVGSGGGSAPTWPTTLAPDTVLPGGPAFASHYVDVDVNSGASETSLALPAYSPVIPPVVMTYNSMDADPRPMIVVHHTLDAALASPTKTSVKLTFDGTAGTTYYYDTSKLSPGSVVQFALQADATAKSTGRYDYSVTVADIRGSTTTVTYNGTASVYTPSADPFASFGKGWTVAGLGRVVSATGGVVLYDGAGDALWFATVGSTGGVTSYTSPAGEFSALTRVDVTGVYTRTFPDGTRQVFNSSGYQTARVDRNGLRVTYAYDGVKLQTITDPYSKVTTFSYDGSGRLQKVEDPANRLTTFTVSSDKLTDVRLPDGATWTYDYDASKRLTKVVDPRSKVVTVAYDAAGRVGTVTRPDTSAETYTPFQKRGYDTSGTSGSPAPAVLMAESRATQVDANGNAADVRPDWRGMGLVNQKTDALGNVATRDRDANGLATVAIDRLNRISTYSYDGLGNVTRVNHPDGTFATFTYNSFSQVTHMTDGRGKQTSYTYDGEGNLTATRDALGNRTTLTYTANGRVETAKDARNNVTSYAYDSQDRLTTVTYPGGATTKIAYDAKGNVATVTDERGFSTTVAYDALNRPTGETDALGNRTTYVYDSGGNVTQVQAPLSRTTDYAYDALNRVTTVTAPLSRTTTMAYDSGGRLKSQTDPLGRRTTYGYDAEDRVTEVNSPLEGATSRRVTYTYDAEGQRTTVKDPLGRVTSSTYNSRGWVETVTDPLGNVTTYSYTATGKIGQMTEPVSGGSSYFYTYDDVDRLIEVLDPLTHYTTTVYDAVGNVQAKVDGNGNRTTLAYDARNRLTTITDPLSHATVYGYDSGGNRTTVTDALSHTTTTAYDALGRATTVTDARGGVITFAYDAGGRQTLVVDPVGNRTTFAYDAADRLTTLTDALGTATMAYDAADQLTSRHDRIGRRVTYAYDSGGRQVGERWINVGGSTARSLTYTYDAADQLTVVKDPDATLTFAYDAAGRRTTVVTSGPGTGQPTVTLTYGYDESGKRTSLTDSLSTVGRTTYQYDAAQRLTTIARSLGASAGPRVVFGYDAGDRRTSVERSIGGAGTKITSTLAYDVASRLTTMTHQISGGAVLATYVYGYDNANRLQTETNAEGQVTYAYDVTDQLTTVTGARSESYGYDLAGNRNTSGYATISGNRMSTSPGYTYTYDAEGNLSGQTETTTGKITTYAYDHRNRMVGATQKNSGGTVVMQATYTYEALGRRIGMLVDADGAGVGAAARTWTVFDGDNPYADFDSGGTLQQRYLYGLAVDELLARTDNAGSSRWYLGDRLGTVRDIVDTAGVSVYHAAYESFGKIVSETGAGGDRYKFTAREWDGVLGLQYNRARYYNQDVGRWTARDPIGLSSSDYNLYRYVHNKCTYLTDPSGLYGESGTPSNDPSTAPPAYPPTQGPYPRPLPSELYDEIKNYDGPQKTVFISYESPPSQSKDGSKWPNTYPLWRDAYQKSYLWLVESKNVQDILKQYKEESVKYLVFDGHGFSMGGGVYKLLHVADLLSNQQYQESIKKVLTKDSYIIFHACQQAQNKSYQELSNKLRVPIICSDGDTYPPFDKVTNGRWYIFYPDYPSSGAPAQPPGGSKP